MLDVFDFIVDKGGDPQKVKQSQQRRYAPEAVVQEVQELYEEARRSKSIHAWLDMRTEAAPRQQNMPHRK